ncbi:MAG: zinc-dependent alcohol dehydrogenase family protein [Legionella sp.]|uniref:zinc-dependent alcohol dehydrogenase family protein n=1 Tax=Legionella sp. TaxID=459 RepID=UPI00283F589C|nr:zinc-dependent alcohol dehydrogenase family protein [Legionella sp.]
MTEKAKVVRFHETGEAKVLKLEEHPLPNPAPGEVRLRVHAIGLNRAEVMFRRGRYLTDPQLPSKIGYEASGIVEAVGMGVDSEMVGKKFSTIPCFNMSKYGVYGEVAIVPAYALAAYPEEFSFAEGTAIWMQYLTAYGALVHYGKLSKGDYVLITAASSSVGVAAIEIAKAQGAISIATTRTAKKESALKALGADHVIVTDIEDLPTRVQEITQGKGARIVFDPIGGPGIEKLAAAVANQGIIFEYGALSSEPTPYPLFTALTKGCSIRGYTLFELTSTPHLLAEGVHYVYEHLKNKIFKPKIARTFKLDQIVEAHQYMESNEQIGKIVVLVS